MTNGFNPAAFNPHDPEFLRDPYPTYGHFRDEAPIYKVKPYESWWVFRYDDCAKVLTEKDVWVKNSPLGRTQEPGPYGVMSSSFPAGLFNQDPPCHELLRAVLQPLFDQTTPEGTPVAEGVAQKLLVNLSKRGYFELVSEYALPLPSTVLFMLLGIPDGAVEVGGEPFIWEGLIEWQALIANAFDITQPRAVRALGATAGMALNSFFEAMLLANQRQPGAGLFAEMCAAFKARGLSNQEVQVCASDFLVAGYLSTTFIIGTGVRNLLLNPGQLRALRDNPSLIGQAFEEMMRFDGPVHLIDRVAARETTLGNGQTFKKGEKVTAVVGSANRDPLAYKSADKFLIRRKAGRPHLGFGEGIHYCIGAPLARRVGPVAIRELLKAFPSLELAGIEQWQTDPYLRALTNLPLSV
jgi:cytochrome P450